MSPSARGARVTGFDARLQRHSRYANPYSDLIDTAVAEGRKPGWLYQLQAAWWLGWHQADEMCATA